jgi:hypothetical protein
MRFALLTASYKAPLEFPQAGAHGAICRPKKKDLVGCGKPKARRIVRARSGQCYASEAPRSMRFALLTASYRAPLEFPQGESDIVLQAEKMQPRRMR